MSKKKKVDNYFIKLLDLPFNETTEEQICSFLFKKPDCIQLVPNPSERMLQTAIQRNGLCIKYIKDPSIKLQLTAIRHDRNAIRFIESPPEEVQLASIKENPFMIKFINNPTEQVKKLAESSSLESRILNSKLKPKNMDQTSIDYFDSIINSFKNFLINKGACIIPNDEKGVLIHFHTDEGEAKLLNKNNKIYFSNNIAYDAYKAYRIGDYDTSWNAFTYAKPKRLDPGKQRDKQIELLKLRDGLDCVYCTKTLKDTDITLEHFLPISMGGSNNLHNMGLACRPCNTNLGNLPVAVKLKITINRRKKLDKKLKQC